MKYRSLLLAGAAFQVGSVHAIGLGNMDVESYLGVPLQAQINLVAQRELTVDEVKIRLADADVYARFGARDLVDHGRMEFDVYTNAQGQLTVRVVSSKRIVEPYIDMVVELRWPQGVTYRQYQVLLDPPRPTPYLQAAVHPVSQQPALALPPAVDKAEQSPTQQAKPLSTATKPTPALQPTTTPVASAEKTSLVSKPEDEINELRAELLRLQRERAALLAHRNAIRTELQALKEVQLLADQHDSTLFVPEISPESVEQIMPVVAVVPANSDTEADAAAPSIALLQEQKIEVSQRDSAPFVANLGLPLSGETLTKHFNAQEMINSDSIVVSESQPAKRSSMGVWVLITLLPLVFLIAFFLMRARLVLRTKSSESVKDEDLYELVFGGQRDRTRVENKEQVGKALQQIKAKATLHQFSGSKEDPILVEENEDTGVDLDALLAEVELPEEENDWMVKAPILRVVR